ncbi:MAG: isopenicillin N synthase-like dioxygenase [Gammaproteobacteria bacterium]|jgi:isopenicillin N synthase-like dioxygenase
MLPIFKFSDLQSDHEDRNQAIVRLRDACHNPGFFYLTDHGLESSLDVELLDISRQFFDLPETARHSIDIANSAHFRGYTVLGSEQTAGKSDWRDQIDVGPEEPAPGLKVDDPPWKRLRGPNQWPAELPQMREIVSRWMHAIEPLAMTLLKAIAVGLGQSADIYDQAMAPNPYPRMKIMRYPALPDNEATGQGLGLHHDSGVLTIILQDSVPGLQVERDGQLIDVEPLPGAYIVNLGEMMQSSSNGYLRATKHQVVSPPAGQQRISIAYFFNPRLDAEFSAIDLPDELANKAVGGQNLNPQDPVYPIFGDNTLKIRMRAHPDVADKFYPDVEL